MRIVFNISLEYAVVIRETENNLLMQKFWGVDKMFDGRCENGEYVSNFILLIFFEILHIKNV